MFSKYINRNGRQKRGKNKGKNKINKDWEYIYIYIYGYHKTLISYHGCSYYQVITGQKEQTIFCITFRHSPSSDASFQQITFPEYTILQYSFSFIIILQHYSKNNQQKAFFIISIS